MKYFPLAFADSDVLEKGILICDSVPRKPVVNWNERPQRQLKKGMHRNTSRIHRSNTGRRNHNTLLRCILPDVFEKSSFTGACFPGKKDIPRRLVDEVRGRTEERVVVHSVFQFTTRSGILKGHPQSMQGENTGEKARLNTG